jgi:hypothetical protein
MAKRYLNVSYKDRDLAKRLGARWDPSVKRWYCPAGSPLATIFEWRKEAHLSNALKAQVFKEPKNRTVAQNENFELPLAG